MVTLKLNKSDLNLFPKLSGNTTIVSEKLPVTLNVQYSVRVNVFYCFHHCRIQLSNNYSVPI